MIYDFKTAISGLSAFAFMYFLLVVIIAAFGSNNVCGG